MSEDKKVYMNEELLKWIEETKLEIETHKKEKVKEPSGKCEICGKKVATSICLKCGKSVCNSCYFKIISICKQCIPEEIRKKWEGSMPDWEKELGIDWVA